MIDLTDAFDGLDPARLAVDRDDFHPNAMGHARLAQRLDRPCKRCPRWRRIWETAARLGEHVEHLARSTKTGRPARRRTGSTRGLPCRLREGHHDETPESGSVGRARIGIVKSILPCWSWPIFPGPRAGTAFAARSIALRSPELNRAEREGHAAGYYEGLIGGN